MIPRDGWEVEGKGEIGVRRGPIQLFCALFSLPVRLLCSNAF